MIQRTSHNQTISMASRYPLIMDVLKKATEPLSAYRIVIKYIDVPTLSDQLVTGTILNVLALAGVVKKHETFKGKSVRLAYELVNRSFSTVYKEKS